MVVILNPDTDGFQYYTLPNNDFPCDLQWIGNSSFIGIAMTDSTWRLGAIYCANRESRIFQMDEHGHRKYSLAPYKVHIEMLGVIDLTPLTISIFRNMVVDCCMESKVFITISKTLLRSYYES